MDDEQRVWVHDLFYKVLIHIIDESRRHDYKESIDKIYGLSDLSWEARVERFKDYILEIFRTNPHHIAIFPYGTEKRVTEWVEKTVEKFSDYYYRRKQVPHYNSPEDRFLYWTLLPIFSDEESRKDIEDNIFTKAPSFEERVRLFKEFALKRYDERPGYFGNLFRCREAISNWVDHHIEHYGLDKKEY